MKAGSLGNPPSHASRHAPGGADPLYTGQWRPSDSGLISWTCDPVIAGTGTSTPVAGTLYGVCLTIPYSTTITNLLIYVGTSGTSLTSGRNFAGLYNSSNALLSATADQTTAWGSAGLKTMALSSPQSVNAGDIVKVCFYSNGSTTPAFVRSASATSGAAANFNQSSNYRMFTANTGLTTALPATIGSQTVGTLSWIVGLS